MATRKHKSPFKRFGRARSKKQKGGARSKKHRGGAAARETVNGSADNAFKVIINSMSDMNPPDKEQVLLLLRHGANINIRADYDYNALEKASRFGFIEFVEMLLKNGANMEDGDHATALMTASWHGHLKIARMLLDKGANVNAADKWYETALSSASTNGHNDLVKMLLKEGADVNAKNNAGNVAALRSAIGRGHTETVKLLLENGANVNVKGKWDKTSLIEASVKGHTEIVKLLLEYGANVDAKDQWGQTALVFASHEGHREIVKMLTANIKTKGLKQDAMKQVRNKTVKFPSLYTSALRQLSTDEMTVFNNLNMGRPKKLGGKRNKIKTKKNRYKKMRII